jgi:hypothetical protein
MKRIFFVCEFFFVINLCSGQRSIEILVNEENQNLSREDIRVKSKDDKIEVRIYYQNSDDRNSLIDSIETKGCGIRIIQKNKFVLFPPKQPQQQQQSSTRPVQKKFEIIGSIRPVQKDGYLSFSSSVNNITACQGKKFYFELMYNDKKSIIKKFTNYSKVYNFYYVL